jgi:uncharacterized protein YndB with AHSA1/START domain
MTAGAIEHASFSAERHYRASPARVFAAWADPTAKARWFGGPEDWTTEPHQLDFRVGGRERSAGGPSSGPIHVYLALYWDIVENRRIVYTYEMLRDDTRISVSLTSVELERDGEGTRLRLTEHGAFFDGHEPAAMRTDGVGSLLDALAAELERGPANGGNPPEDEGGGDTRRSDAQ